MTISTNGLPAALAPLVAQPNWVVWRWVTTRQGKRTKVPYQAAHPTQKASTKEPTTWGSYAQACAVAQTNGFDGIGFVLTGTEIAAFDIDDCRNPATAAIHPWAQQLVARVGSYAEVTTSGTGLRIIGIGTGAQVHRKLRVVDGVTCEVYRGATRYIVMTGAQFNNNSSELTNVDAAVDEVVAELDRTAQRTHAR